MSDPIVSPPVPLGKLVAVRGRPNPAGAATALYLLRGAPAAAPIQEIIAEPTLLPGRPAFHLSLLHFNDLHGNLAEVSQDVIRPVFSRMAGYIRRLRQRYVGRRDVGVLTFSGGDDLVGSAFTELAGRRSADFRCHSAFRLYSAAGVDAGAVGNHDLDWGLEMLACAARQDAAFPLLSANLLPAAGAADTGIYPAALFVVNDLRVGVIGLTTPSEIKHVLPGEFTIADPIATVHNLLPALRPLCDVLIVLSHLGYSLADPSAVASGAGDLELARALPRGTVHLIIGGHTHSVLNEQGLEAANWVNGVAILQAGAYGRHLGEVAVDVTSTSVTVTAANLHRVDALDADAEFEMTQVQPLAEQVQRMLNEPIGVVTVGSDLDPTPACQGTALASFIADALVARCRTAGFPVDFALVDASSLCAELPQAGVLTFGDLFRLAPYADSIVLCRLTPVQVQALLDDNARRADLRSCCTESPGEERGFLQFSREVCYRLAGDPPRGLAHAADVTISDVPLAQLLAAHPEPFLVACSSFVRQLASCWERKTASAGERLFDLRALPIEQTGLALREELVAYVQGI